MELVELGEGGGWVEGSRAIGEEARNRNGVRLVS